MARRPNKPARRPVAAQQAPAARDSYQNVAARLGIGTDNLQSQGRYGFNPITRSRQDLEFMYRGSWIAGQAIDCVAEDMTRAGIDIASDLDPDEIGKIHRGFERLNLWQSLTDCIKWSRLYGGGVAIILIEGQDLATPLRPQTVSKGQFHGLYTLDRWTVQPSYDHLIEEIGPHLGKPKYYTVLASAPVLQNRRIHHSRIIRMDGIALPYWQSAMEQGWGMSVIERLYDRLVAFDSATTGVGQLVFKAHLRTISVDGLRELLAQGGKTTEALVKMFEMIRTFQSSEGFTILDSKDTFATHSYAFSGLSDVLLQFAQQLSGALQIPLVRLFGQSPAGLNSTGESDVRTYYDLITQQQEAKLRGGVETIVDLLCRSELGIDPPADMTITFRSLWQMSEEQRAAIAAQITAAVTQAEGAQIIDRATAMKELKRTADRTGVFSSITDEMIEAAEREEEVFEAPLPDLAALTQGEEPDAAPQPEASPEAA